MNAERGRGSGGTPRGRPGWSLLVLVVLSVGGCGGDDDTTQPPVPPATVYVDAAWTGPEEGTRDRPFNTLAEGLAAAARGATLELAAGDYGAGGDVVLPRAITLQGVGSGLTRVANRVLVGQSAAAGDTTRVRRLACAGVAFAPGLTTPTPLVADSCAFVAVAIAEPGTHHVALRACVVSGDIAFTHGGGTAINAVSRCAIGGRVRVVHGTGQVHDTVAGCAIAAGVELATGTGGSATITDNAIAAVGISDVSSGRQTLIARNALASGSIVDRSGGLGIAHEDEIIADNVLADGGIACSALSATIRGNTITCASNSIGIHASAGDPTHIIGNTILVPYAEPVGEPQEWTCFGILTVSGPGSIVDNVVTGGSCGIMDRSGAAAVSGNVISGAHHGLWAAGAGDYVGNTVTDCRGDGIIVRDTRRAFAGNFAGQNDGAGLRLFSPADLGGGARGCPGNNQLHRNAGFDLVVEVTSDVADTVFARHNGWDHIAADDIGALDVFDGADAAGRAIAAFMPVHSARGILDSSYLVPAHGSERRRR